MNKQPLTTFSGVFDEVTESDERPYINSVIEQGGIKSHFVHPDRMSPLVELEQVLWHQEEPLWTPNLFMHWGLYSSAQQQGIRVFLDGFLGDNVVCHGWEHLMDLAYAWRWFSLFREIRGVARRQAGYSSHQMVRRYLWECSIKPWIPNQLRRAWRMIRLFRNPSSSKVHLGFKFNPDFARRIHLARRRRALQPSPVNPPGAAKQRHHQDLTAGEIPLGLEISNKISKAFSLEVWYPFTDRRLAELCLATPSHQRIQDGWSRMIVRRALANHLPAKVCWRSDKGDLSHNLVRGLLRFEEQRMDEVILNNAQVIEPYIDTTELRKSYMHYKQKGTSDDIQAIWSAVNLATWLRHTNANLACDYSNKFQKA
jgi:asparagine synthase (glutamine-hydrolysing)